MVVVPSSGAIQLPSATATAFLSAHVWASVLRVKPRLERTLPAGSRYWTRQRLPDFVVYGVMLAIMGVSFLVVGLVAPWHFWFGCW